MISILGVQHLVMERIQTLRKDAPVDEEFPDLANDWRRAWETLPISSARMYNVLRIYDFTVAQLASLSRTELLGIKRIGKALAEEIRDTLRLYGPAAPTTPSICQVCGGHIKDHYRFEPCIATCANRSISFKITVV